MSRRPEQRIEDIRLCCEKILRYTSGMSQETLAGDELVTDAVLRNIEIIGEATKNLPEGLRAKMPGHRVEEDRRDAGLALACVLPGRSRHRVGSGRDKNPGTVAGGPGLQGRGAEMSGNTIW